MLENKLNNEIHARISLTYRACSLIVMHPKTWQDLLEECLASDSMAIFKFNPNMIYKGVKVLRSLDMTEGEFEVR